MLLSRLELTGFKSFPERTVLEFNGGITGVVGPNGCGKSNILDSIRWVLGEQRTSVLRSAKMEEVIFSGTKTLKPTGMAEVNLIIKNNRGVLPIEYDNIVITRRLFRSGESEYYLNKNRCRLKDIMELFFDTGMGPHAYSVIQQGMIDSILSDKTEDRRSLFEEAAGVTKYKHRKKEAENKLQATEADLLRLGDVLAEIEKQVIQLRRQAKRTRRYSMRKNDLKSIELTLAAALLFESQEKYKNLQDEKRALELEVESSIAKIDRLEVNIQDLKLNLSECESEAIRFRQDESAMSLEAANAENEIKLNKQRLDSSIEEIEKRKSDITSLHHRIENLQREINEKDNRLNDAELQKTQISDRSEAAENELFNLMEENSRAEKDLECRKAGYNEISGKISAHKAERASLEEMKRSLKDKMAEIEENTRGYDDIKRENHDNMLNLEKRHAELVSQLTDLKSKQKSGEEELVSREESAALMRDRLSIKKGESSGLQARKELLEQLIESGEGYSGGAKAIIAWENKPSGILMPVAEALEVPEQYRIAVNAALGDMGELIPVRTYDDARAAIEYLKNNNAGRSTFIALDRLGALPDPDNRPNDTAGLIGFLDDLVSFPDDYEPVVRLLLGRVALFDSEDAALNADGRWEYFTRVSRDGLVILPSAMFSGGKAAGGIFGRRYDLQEIKEKLEELLFEINQEEGRFNGEREHLSNVRAELEDGRKKIAEIDADRNKIEAELAQMNFDFRQRENEYSAAVNESLALRNEIDRYERKIAVLEEELNLFEGNLTAKESEVGRSSEIVEKLKSRIKEAEGNLTKIRIKKVELDGLANKIKSDIDHEKEICLEAERMIESNNDGIAKAEAAIENVREKIDELKSNLESHFIERARAKDGLLRIEGIISEKMGEISDIEKQLIDKRKSREKSQSLLHNLDMELMDLESSRKSITDRISYEFGTSKVEPSPLEQHQTVDSLKEQAEKIRLELQRMEPVNLMAEEDYERENDRYNFLIRQKEDLLDAKASLKEAINRINTTAEQRFLKTFDAIEKNYQNVFSKLFENGEAHVELEDPSLPLESPIRILARPGGKKLLSVAQLSGGERALTAISLLFAIYLVKPSPFCILDEVDAPLDDINLVRFLQLIKGFAKDTQFIVITHNKLTMEASDILYGVTMENPGVSKVVSVRFGGGNGDGDNN
ncbi:MAG: chromosome segregation protein SMC [Candidatus Zixiibacteriota bacterium]|nr:MAG: chromosome segregation protein SMC [candidate division Zixibacteria bacterium]